MNTGRFPRAVPGAIVAVAVLAGGCASATAYGHPAAKSTTSPGAAPIVYAAAAVTPQFALVAVGPGPQGGSGPQLLAVTATGTRISAVGPPVPADQLPDSIFVLDRDHFWFATYSEGGGGETLYRTSDGGRHWQSSAAPSHSLDAGSTDSLQFVSPLDGWLADIQPTGPVEALYRTTDGGASWDLIARLDAPSPTPSLPRLGLVTFESSGALGWLGGSPSAAPVAYPGPLEVSRDQGRSWQASALPVTQGDIVGAPASFTMMLAVPVVRCVRGVTELRMYVSTDQGTTWSLAAAEPVATGCQQVETAFASPSAGWASTLSSGKVRVLRTTDHGHSWVPVPALVLRTSFAPEIVALDASHAWLLVAGLDVNGSRIYATADAGRSWHRIDEGITGSREHPQSAEFSPAAPLVVSR